MPARAAVNVKHSIPQGPNVVQNFFQTRDLGKKKKLRCCSSESAEVLPPSYSFVTESREL